MGEYTVPSGFRIAFFNARSMKGKLTDIKECFNDDLDVLCVGESWLNDGIDAGELLWIGNTMYRMDRTTDRAGGLM